MSIFDFAYFVAFLPFVLMGLNWLFKAIKEGINEFNTNREVNNESKE